MARFNKALVAVGIAASGLTGGVIGATIMGAGTAAINAAPVASTAATSGSAATAAPAAAPAAGTFKSNEDATHEAGESAAREAAENNGTAGIPQRWGEKRLRQPPGWGCWRPTGARGRREPTPRSRPHALMREDSQETHRPLCSKTQQGV